MSVLAFFTFGVLPRRAIPRTFEMDIAFSARTTLTQNKFLAVPRKIDNRIICIRHRALGVERWAFSVFRRPDDCSDRNLHDFVRRRTPMLFLSHSVCAAFRL